MKVFDQHKHDQGQSDVILFLFEKQNSKLNDLKSIMQEAYA